MDVLLKDGVRTFYAESGKAWSNWLQENHNI
jgi:hypothetical protein